MTQKVKATLNLILQSSIDASEKTIQEFKDQVEQSPRYALEWADHTYLAVARLEQDSHLLKVFERVKAEAPISHSDLDELLESLDYWISVKIGESTLSGSTSSSHRLLCLAQAQVAASWFITSTLRSPINRKSVLKALTELVKD